MVFIDDEPEEERLGVSGKTWSMELRAQAQGMELTAQAQGMELPSACCVSMLP